MNPYVYKRIALYFKKINSKYLKDVIYLMFCKSMKICLYPGGIDYFKMGGIKTAYENKKQALHLQNIEWSDHPLKVPFDILQLELPSFLSAFYALWARKKKKKIVMSTHMTIEDFRETFTFSKTIIYFLKKYLIWYYSLADVLISPSEYTKELVNGYGVTKPIKVVSNGLHPSFLDRSSPKILDRFKTPVIGTAGFVTKRKGVVTFCNVARALPDCQFKWAGSIHEALLFDIRSIKKPDNVVFLGYVQDIKQAYSIFDVFLFPSFEENQGIVLLEAASFGLPLVIRDLPVYSGWLVHGENCLKCTSDDEFVENLKRILVDKKLRQRLSENALLLAKSNDLRSIGLQLTEIYEHLL